MKILLISSSSGSRGGGELFLIELAKGLLTKGHEVAIWCSDHLSMNEFCQRAPDDCTILRSNYTNSYQRVFRGFMGAKKSDLKAAIALWEKWIPDLIHLNKQNLEDGLDLYKALTKIRGGRFISTIHITQSMESLGAVGGKFRDNLSRRALNRSNSPKVAVSDQRKEDLIDFLDTKHQPISRVYNGVTSLGTTERAIDNSILHYVAVGRLEGQKRPLLFLDYVKEITSSYPNCRFTWVGDGSLNEAFHNKIKTLQLEDYVTCTGWVDDLTKYYEEADVYLHTAEFEGLPLAILEAFSYGLPCVLPSSIASEVSVFKKDDFWTLEPEQWIEESNQSKLRKKMGLRSRELYNSYFSIEAMTDEYLTIYQNILGYK